MGDFLDVLAAEATRTLARGYYDVEGEIGRSKLSLRKAIEACPMNPIISEVKKASPSLGSIRPRIDAVEAALAMEAGGAAGISVLTEPEHFGGSLRSIRRVKESVEVPVLMKDIVVSPVQVDSASKTGADAILLIKAIFERGLGTCDLDTMIDYAHRRGLEVLLEAHKSEEFEGAQQSCADLIGINNRDLKTLDVDLRVTAKILGEYDPGDRIVVSESGIRVPEDINRLREVGARAFLIGSAIMQSDDIGSAVRRFAMA
jgi:indole-3-glycerol phosphate synthase